MYVHIYIYIYIYKIARAPEAAGPRRGVLQRGCQRLREGRIYIVYIVNTVHHVYTVYAVYQKCTVNTVYIYTPIYI